MTKTAPHADADEPELIAMPPAPQSAPLMSNLERCVALRLVYGAGPHERLRKIATCITSQRHSLLSRVSVVSCAVPALVFPRPDHLSQALRLSGSQTVTDKIVAGTKHGKRSPT